jgi:hypothetical protein
MVTIRCWALLLALPLATGSCAEMYAQRAVGASVELAETCAAGPYCVTGAIMTQNGTPISGVRCIAEWSDDEPTLAFSDHHGLFEMSALRAIPRKLRFEKDGFEAQPVSVVDHLRHRAALKDAATMAELGREGPATAPSSSTAAGTASTSAVASNGGAVNPTDDTAATEAGTPTRLLGEGATATDDNPDQQFDFGDGSTLRVFVTMRRSQ